MIAEPAICGTFTRARRYPLIVARVWGRRISLNASVGVALGLVLVWATRGLWQHGFLAAHVAGLRAALGARAAALHAAVTRHLPGARVSPATGGYFVWLRLPGQVDTAALLTRARAAEVLV